MSTMCILHDFNELYLMTYDTMLKSMCRENVHDFTRVQFFCVSRISVKINYRHFKVLNYQTRFHVISPDSNVFVKVTSSDQVTYIIQN